MAKPTQSTPDQPTPEHQRGGHDMPQRHPVPAPRPHPEDTLPRRAPGGSL